MENKLFKNYEMISCIGRGGMAEVWKAKDKNTEKLVAIKQITRGIKSEIEFLRDEIRFKNEFKTIRKINSPYVMKVLDADINSEDKMIVCEYIQGEELKKHIKKLSVLTVDEVVDISKQICLGLKAIHDTEVIHRDIKSSNIMITSNGKIKIIDFGIATSKETEAITKTNSIIGSVYYIAPELIEKIPPSIQSDIYSLGILMYEMLIGEPPFKSNEASKTALMHKNYRVPWVNKANISIPQSIANIVWKATAKNPEYRYKSMLDFYKDLETSLDSTRINEAPINLRNNKPKKFIDIINSKHTIIFTAIVVIISILMITGLLIYIIFVKGV